MSTRKKKQKPGTPTLQLTEDQLMELELLLKDQICLMKESYLDENGHPMDIVSWGETLARYGYILQRIREASK